MKKKKIVLSGVNLDMAGPLSIMKDALAELSGPDYRQYEIIALVYKKELYSVENITFMEFPDSKEKWSNRIRYEYSYFKQLSRELKPDIWISMHDMTPSVECPKRYVYCHNATPFYWPSIKDWKYGSRASLFSLLYIYLYRINIKKNTALIVQQQWMRNKFQRIFGVKNIIVAYPDANGQPVQKKLGVSKSAGVKKVFFPSFPRSFKNFEVVCKAYSLLDREYQSKLEVILTLNQELNAYGKYVYDLYGHLEGIRFIGLITREEVYSYYDEVDALVFPSKLESWGLPITEFKGTEKPIFLADLEYAHETLGDYNAGYFFDPKKAEGLAALFRQLVDDSLPDGNCQGPTIDPPFFTGWKALLNHILTTE